MAAFEGLGAGLITRQTSTDLKYLSDNEFEDSHQRTYRSTGHWTFIVITFPWTRFQTWGTGCGTGFFTRIVNAALAAGFLAFVVASLALGVARTTTKVLTIQGAFAWVLGVVYACDQS